MVERANLLKGRWRSKCICHDVRPLPPLNYCSVAQDIRRTSAMLRVFSGNLTRSMAQHSCDGVASIHRLAHQRLLLHCTPRCSGTFRLRLEMLSRLVTLGISRKTVHFGTTGIQGTCGQQNATYRCLVSARGVGCTWGAGPLLWDFVCSETAFPRSSMVSCVHPRATAHSGVAGTCSRLHGRGSLAFPSRREGICSDSGGRTCISSGVQVAPRRCAASSHV